MVIFRHPLKFLDVLRLTCSHLTFQFPAIRFGTLEYLHCDRNGISGFSLTIVRPESGDSAGECATDLFAAWWLGDRWISVLYMLLRMGKSCAKVEEGLKRAH